MNTPDELNVCRFPGCDQTPVAGQGGRGRRSLYCDHAGHTRITAFQARRQAAVEMAEAAVTDESESPLTARKARAADLVAGTIAAGTAHIETLERLIEQLGALGDPSLAEDELEAVRFDAEKRIASANAKAAKAEVAKRQMSEQQAEAEVVADEAVLAMSQLQAQLREQSESHEVQVEELMSAHAAELDGLGDEVARSKQDLAAIRAELTEATSDLAAMRNERDEAVRRRDETEAHKLTLDGRIEVLRQKLADSSAAVAAHTARADRLEGDLVRLRVDHDALSNDRTALQKEVSGASADSAAAAARLAQVEEHTDHRIDDLRAGYEARLQDLRDQLAKSQDQQRPEEGASDDVSA